MKSEEVSTLLRRAIRSGVLKPGEDLVQEEIAARLGVSRVPLREALRGLAAVGVVKMNPGRGFQVTSLDASEIFELYDLRLKIEPLIAANVIAHARPPHIEALEELDRRMNAAQDPEQWANLNFDFHLSMYEVVGMSHTARIVEQLLDLVEPYSRVYVHELQNLDRVHHEHDSMIDAIKRGDEETLRLMIVDHLEGARDGLVSFMEAGTPEADPVSRLAGLKGSK